MTLHKTGLRPTRLGAFSLTSLVAVSAAALLVVSAGSAQAATSVPLGTAGSFVVLAGAGITNTGPTTLNGDLGTFPTTSVSGAGTLTVTGTNHGGDAVTQGAKSDLVTAYNNAAGQGPTTPIAADLAGQTLTPGVYNSASSVGLSGALTLDAGGDPNAVFVFQAGSTLTTASGSIVNLVNGAQSCNVYWQVGSSATLGTGSAFRGTILALTSITLTTAATVEGRVLARNGAVTLDTNTITRPACTGTGATATATPSASGSTRATATPTRRGGGGGGGGGGGETTDQVENVPSGPVDSGNDTGSGGHAGQLLAVTAGLTLVGGMGAVAARKRGSH